jgi:DNA-binding transcriptional LysR family regulator
MLGLRLFERATRPVRLTDAVALAIAREMGREVAGTRQVTESR